MAVLAVNDAPSLAGVESTPLLTTELVNGNTAPVYVTTSLLVSDVDSATLISATVSVSTNFEVGDVLSCGNPSVITGNFNAGTGVCTFSGSDTQANYQAALRSVTFISSGGKTSKTLMFTVNDGVLIAAAVYRTITQTSVNDPPVLTGLETASLAYTEKAIYTLVTSTLVLSDVDSSSMASATVTVFRNDYENANLNSADTLKCTTTGSIMASFDTNYGICTFSGVDSIANYQVVSRASEYTLC